MLVQSEMYSDKFNRVSKMQHYFWTQELTKESRYLLWFKIFKTQDRVRLWNTLVFSENYFTYVANTRKFKRADIRHRLAEIK